MMTTATFPIDLEAFEPLALDPAGEPDGAQLEKLAANVRLCRDAIVFFTATGAAKGLGGHTGGPYDIVLTSLALHAIIGHNVDPLEAESRYELLFHGIRDSLTPGGHLLVGDHVGTLGLFRQLKTMERAGFIDVDCAWRQDDFFVCGGRVPE